MEFGVASSVLAGDVLVRSSAPLSVFAWSNVALEENGLAYSSSLGSLGI